MPPLLTLAPAVTGWVVAIVFAISGLEKVIIADLRARFREAVADVLPPWARVSAPLLAAVFLASELAVIPLLWLQPPIGLNVLLGLTLVVIGYAAVQWHRGVSEGCPCGGLWTASGRNLFIRNSLLLLLAILAHRLSPVPLPAAAFWYGLAVLVLFIVVAGLAEGIRIQLKAR